jgi:hypothetical protein
MKLFNHILPVAALALGLASNGKADLVIAAPAEFTKLVAADIQGTAGGTPFFDNDSTDEIGNAICNIGALLTGKTAISSANCFKADERAASQQLATGDDVYDYLHDGTGANVNTLKLKSTSGGGTIYLEMELGIAGTGNVLEIRKVGTDAVLATFIGSDVSGATKQIVGLNADEEYYFWFSGGPGSAAGGPWRSDTDATRFALFRVGQGSSTNLNVNTFVLAIEDGVDWDYNDMVITANVVPEPASVIVLSSAVLGTLALVRRRRAQK